MSNSDNEELAGLPVMARLPHQNSESLSGSSPRENEAGIIVQCPKRVVSADPSQALSRTRVKTKNTVDCQSTSLFRAFAGAVNAGLLAFLALATVAFVLFIAANAVPLLLALEKLPAPFRIGGYIGLLILAAITVVFSLRLVWLYWKLRVNQQFALSEFEAIDGRLETRKLNQDLQGAGVTRLQEYLRSYPVDDSQRDLLLSCGCSEQDWKHLLKERRRLVGGPDRTTQRSWLEDYASSFQRRLDLAAQQTIGEFAILAGTKTALSPNALIDSAALLYCGLGMFGNLCAIYNLKLGPLATMKFIGWVFAQAYFGGKLQDLSDTAEDQIQDQLNEAFQAVGLVASGPLAAVVGGTAARAGQGFANALLMRRLGNQAMRMLRPVKPSP